MGLTQDKMEFAAHIATHFKVTQSYQAALVAGKLCRLGATHNRLAVEQCNREWTDRDEAKRERIRKTICNIAEGIGATSVVFSNDPRGCTVKLCAPDGYHNDWDHEGICVPTA